MPRDVIHHPDHSRFHSLGWIGVWWIETFVRHGRGGAQGMSIRYGDEYTSFIVDCYAHDKKGRRLYDTAFFSRPKGTDKSGVAAALVLFEAFGPCRFDGWAEGGETYEFLGETYTYQAGEPMGKPQHNPMIRIMATEEGQAGNTYDSVYFNLTNEDAPLYQLRAYGLDVGLTRVILHTGGEIRPSTTGSASKDGGLETFTVFDETHLYTTPALKGMYNTVSRNAVKRRKEGAWYIETTTMYAPGEESIAEETYRFAQMITEGKARNKRLLFDHRYADVPDVNPMKITDDNGVERMETEDEYLKRMRESFEEAYGDAIAWNDIDGLMDSLFDPRQSITATFRYFFNALVAASDAWVDPQLWKKNGLKAHLQKWLSLGLKPQWTGLRRGDQITLGFDGGRSDDATVLIACRVSDGLVAPIRIWEAPDTAEANDWTIDHQEVDAIVQQTHKKYRVVGFFADPPLWQDYVDKWSNLYADTYIVKASASKPLEFWTAQSSRMIPALERVHTAIANGELPHTDHPTLTRHVLNARRRERPQGTLIGKERKKSPKKIDAAIGMTLAYEARAKYLKDHKPEQPVGVPIRVR